MDNLTWEDKVLEVEVGGSPAKVGSPTKVGSLTKEVGSLVEGILVPALKVKKFQILLMSELMLLLNLEITVIKTLN